MAQIHCEATGVAYEAVERYCPRLVDSRVATRIFNHDNTLWGKKAAAEASVRLGWTQAPAISQTMLAEIERLRTELKAEGLTRIVLCGMGGSSLAPEVMAKTAGVNLVVIDTTEPTQIRAGIEQLPSTVVIVSSKSGGTLETDSARRAFAAAFKEAGINPRERIIVVTDPGSSLDQLAQRENYRAIFHADPNVGGRYSALTAFGLVPAGLAGVNIRSFLQEAAATLDILNNDDINNVGLRLGAALGASIGTGQSGLRNKIVIVDEDSGILGFPDWAEQLLAESTGKDRKGILPVAATTSAPELSFNAEDILVVRVAAQAQGQRKDITLKSNEVVVGGSLPAQIVVWEFATAVASHLLGVDPFNQPDVEAAKAAARQVLKIYESGAIPAPSKPDFIDGVVTVRALLPDPPPKAKETLAAALRSLFQHLGPKDYLSIQAYLNRIRDARLESIRDKLAAFTQRPTTFGWGPRFLHSTGQYHKGGAPEGVFLQITSAADDADGGDYPIAGRPFSFGQLIIAQADGDAAVLAERNLPLLRLHFHEHSAGMRYFLNTIDAITEPKA